MKTPDSELQWKIEEHGKICDYIKNLYKTKNADYGDSMHPLFEEYGLTAFLVLFGTKINRVKTLMNKDSHTYESLEDSLMDLANYALIAITELRAENSKKLDVANISEQEYYEKVHNGTYPDYTRICGKSDLSD